MKTVGFAMLPLLAALGATAAVAVNVGDIAGFLFGGQPSGWQRLPMLLILFGPIGLTLTITELLMWRRGRGSDPDRR